MAGGRRRRRSSASSNTRATGDPAADGQRPPPLVAAYTSTSGSDDPAAEPPPAPTNNAADSRLALNGADDPFAYDSELETLSSVSSHSSIGSTNSADLDQALSNPDALPRMDGSDEDDDEADAMLLDDQDPSASADRAIHSENASAASAKGDSDSDQATTAGSYGRFMAKPARASGGASARRRRSPSPPSRRTKQRAGTTTNNNNNSDSRSSSRPIDGAESQEATLAPNAAPESQSPLPADAAGAEDSKENGGEHESSSSSSSSDDEDAAANEVRRSAALSELTQIEVEFAQLRERLYCERMQQVQIEEELLLSGQHADYTRCVEEITSNYAQHLARLKYGHEAWVAQRRQLHETWIRTLSYTFLERRQELRRRLVGAHQRRIWRVRDMRIKEEEQYEARVRAGQAASAIDEDMALIVQQSAESIDEMKHACRVAQTAQRCLVHSRKQQLAAPGLDPTEMDADYRAMGLVVYPRTPKPGPRRIFVPPLSTDAGAAAAMAVAGKKRKPRQPRQPKKRPAPEKGVANDVPAAPAAAAVADGPARVPRVNAQAAGSTRPPQPPQQQQSRVDAVGARLPLVAVPDSAPRPPLPQGQATAGSSSSGSAGDRSSHGSVDMHVPPGSSGPLGLKV